MPERSLVFYCYKEDPDAKLNLKFFLKHGICDSPLVRYVFIINNKECSVVFPTQDNITVWIREENQYDVISYKYVLAEFSEDSLKDYNYFFFLNSSCRGPFIPPYLNYTEKPAHERNLLWLFLFQQMLKTYDLVAPIIEYPFNIIGEEKERVPFVHSYMFAVNSKGFDTMLETFKNHTGISAGDGIELERKIGREIILGGGKVKSLLTRFTHINVTDRTNWTDSLWRPNGGQTCYEIPGNYFGIDVNPYEILFVKVIRRSHQYRGEALSGISETLAKQVQAYTEWLG